MRRNRNEAESSQAREELRRRTTQRLSQENKQRRVEEENQERRVEERRIRLRQQRLEQMPKRTQIYAKQREGTVEYPPTFKGYIIPQYKETLLFKLAESENWLKDLMLVEMERQVQFYKDNDPVTNPITREIRAEIHEWVLHNFRYILGIGLEYTGSTSRTDLADHPQVEQLKNIGYIGVETIYDCMLASDYENENLREIILSYDKTTFIRKMILPAMQDLFVHIRDNSKTLYMRDLFTFLNSSKLIVFKSVPVVYEAKFHKPNPIVLLDRETKPVEVRLSTQEWRLGRPPRIVQPGQADFLPAAGVVVLVFVIQRFLYKVISRFVSR